MSPGANVMCARVLLALAGVALAVAPAFSEPRVYTVTIRDMAFGALPPRLHIGDVVEWVNADIFRHSATAKDKSFDVDLPPKAHVRTILRSAGVVPFYCRYHPGMKGRLTVVK